MAAAPGAGRIVTLTLNPALDLASEAERVEPVHKIRTTGDHVDPGGGGINVARVVHALGGETLAVIASGGVTGRYIEALLEDAGVPCRAVPIQERTRISLTVLDRATGLDYRFVPQGPALAAQEWQALLDAVAEEHGAWLVASGSLPRGAPADAYGQVARLAAARGMRVALDSSGPALAAALAQGVDLVKPSLRELEALAGRTLRARGDPEDAARALVGSGAARMVAVTLGESGALLAMPDGVLRATAPPERVHSAVGAGDAFLAAMVLRLSRGAGPAEALAWAVAAGGAAVSGVGTARIDRAEVERRVATVAVETVG
ncbi:MAG: 1-phosphofructokinase family hexose kinase [Proteobacteria bacterium]|nr:1-phosphofructokinase family hexose kinase [Pseudomonadota bacterium]